MFIASLLLLIMMEMSFLKQFIYCDSRGLSMAISVITMALEWFQKIVWVPFPNQLKFVIDREAVYSYVAVALKICDCFHSFSSFKISTTCHQMLLKVSSSIHFCSLQAAFPVVQKCRSEYPCGMAFIFPFYGLFPLCCSLIRRNY